MKRLALGVLLATKLGTAQLASVPLVLDSGALEAGYTLATRDDGNTPCAVLIPPPKSLPGRAAGSLSQTLGAAPYRGKIVRLSAWLKADSPAASARLWMRANPPNQPSGHFESIAEHPLSAAAWTHSEMALTVDPGSETITFGVLSNGGGPVWIKDVSLALTTGAPAVHNRDAPRNLSFAEGTSAGMPSGWQMLTEGVESSGYTAESRGAGCHIGPTCARLAASAKAAPGSFGALLQTFDAAPWRGRTVRLRGLLRLQASGKEDHARLFLRAGRPGETVSAAAFSDHLDYREVRTTGWTLVEVSRRLDEDVEDLSIGVALMGKGRVSIDELSFSLVPDGEISESGTAPGTGWPSLPRPDSDEQLHALRAASRRAAGYIRDLPNFVCTLSIHRAENRNDTVWQGRDVLSVQLGFADGKERYQLVTVNGRATGKPYRHVGGAISEGDFGSALAEIFRPRSARFYWDRWARLRNRVVHVYRYEVAREKSLYELQFGGAKGNPVSTVTAHHGYVYIDRDSGLILRIEQVADPPAGFPLRTASTVVDYEWNKVGGQLYFLPLRAEISMGTAVLRSLNIVEYGDYKKFGSESQVRFDEVSAADPGH